MKSHHRWAPIIPLTLALAGCVTAPAFEALPADAAPSVDQVAQAPKDWINRPVVWGGMIMEVRNFENHSEIELLAYPLDAKQRPMLELADQGRFIALLPGYAEAREYPAGRFVSLIGRITGERLSTLRSAPYVLPEVDVTRLHLWPRDFRESGSKFSIGVGVRL